MSAKCKTGGIVVGVKQTFRMIAGDEKLADRLIVQSFGGEMVRGVLTKLEFDLTGGFVLYGYIYNADDLLTLAESALPIAHAELLTDTTRCPVYYIKLK